MQSFYGGRGGGGLGGHILREQDSFYTLLGNKETGCQPLLGHRGKKCASGGGLLATSPKRHLPLQAAIHRHGVLRSRQFRRTFAERAQPRVDARGIAKRSGRRKSFSRARSQPTAGETVRRSVSMATIGSQSPRRSIGVKRALLCPLGWTERLLAGRRQLLSSPRQRVAAATGIPQKLSCHERGSLQPLILRTLSRKPHLTPCDLTPEPPTSPHLQNLPSPAPWLPPTASP